MIKVEIEKIIVSGPATVVFWADGTKTVVKLRDGDKDSMESAVSAALVKRILGNSRTKVLEFLAMAYEKTEHVSPREDQGRDPEPQEPAVAEAAGRTDMEDAAPAAVNAGEPRQRLPRSKSPVAPKVDRGKMMALFQAGWAVKDVAVEFSVSEPTVRKAFVDHTGLTVAEWWRMNGIVASNTFS